MINSGTPWRNSTHDWAGTVDAEHLAEIRREPSRFAPDVAHLLLEVLAYAADEAEGTGAGRCAVALHADGSVSVADNGRGTDTRYDDQGRPVRKPVMATKDLRFFDQPDAPLLPNGHPRRGMSVVAALSAWLVHTNRRRDGAWTQRYEHGLPVMDLVPIQSDDSTGTTVRFLPDAVPGTPGLSEVIHLARTAWPHLAVEFTAETTDGVVGRWNDEHGWGVLLSGDVPGEVWVHWSVVDVAGHRTLVPGSAVRFRWERAAQDGFEYRATEVFVDGTSAAPDASSAMDSGGAYLSRLTIEFDTE